MFGREMELEQRFTTIAGSEFCTVRSVGPKGAGQRQSEIKQYIKQIVIK